MFGFTSAEPALTPLPPRLSLRSSTPSPAPPTAASIFRDSPHSPPARPASAASHSPSRSSLAENVLGGWGTLLSQDPRLTIDVCDSVDEYGVRRTSMMALPGGGVAVTGQDAPLLINEMHRAPLSAAQHRRRRIALWSGLLTLVVLGCTCWFTFEVVWSLIAAGAHGRGVVRWVELAAGLVALHCSVAIIPWLRTRRPSALSLPLLGLALLTFGLHLILAAANLVLTIVWRDELGQRCTWGVDVAWTMGQSGEICARDDPKGWIVAGAVRLIITVMVGFLWLTSLRAFYRCLRVSSIIDPSLAPSSEARDILVRHSAGIVPLSSHAHSHSHVDSNYLPPMPDRSAHYAWVSETMSWVPSEADGSVSKSAGVGTWIGAKVMGALGWMMGVDSYETARRKDGGDVEKGEKQAMLLREGRGSEGMPGQRTSTMADRVYSPIDLDNPGSIAERHPALSRADDYRGLFSDIPRPSRARSNSQPTSPLLRPQSFATERSASPDLDQVDDSQCDDHLRQHEHLHQQYLSHSEESKPLPPPPQQHSRTGSSGSTGGSLVYVRMSDGRLVRKLSTIASEASEATSGHRAAASGSAGGTGAQVSRQTSASWATAIDREELLEQDETVEIREVESSVGGWRRSLGR